MYINMIYRLARYADVLVGAPYFTDVLDEGRVYIYLNDGKVGGDIQGQQMQTMMQISPRLL